MPETVILKKSVKAWLDQSRSRIIPAGERIELTGLSENGRTRVYWSGSNEGLGGVMIDEIELRDAI